MLITSRVIGIVVPWFDTVQSDDGRRRMALKQGWKAEESRFPESADDGVAGLVGGGALLGIRVKG